MTNQIAELPITRMHPAIHSSKRLLRALVFYCSHNQHEQDIDSAIVQFSDPQLGHIYVS